MIIKVEVIQKKTKVLRITYPQEYSLHIQGKDLKGVKDNYLSCPLTRKDELSQRIRLPDDYRSDYMFAALREWKKRGKPNKCEFIF